ncbi:MAG TPA: hypothetical protein VLW50_32285 [Streptosporangiaceae bacterium]|nr:hypothetical protein [Streptosporangiaceae bacterium]
MTYTAICARAGRWWEITVPELESGRVTQVRSLDDAESTAKDLVALMTGADPGCILVNVQVPASTRDSHSGRALFATAFVAAAIAAIGAFRRVLQGR